MHGRRFETCHERFVQVLFRELPNIQKYCVLISDAEDAPNNAFRKYYPTMPQLRCWNHFISDIKVAAKKYYCVEQQRNLAAADNHMDKKEIIDHLIDTIKNLLCAASYTEFYAQYSHVSLQWTKAFLEYFEKNILPIVNELGKQKYFVVLFLELDFPIIQLKN